MQTSSDSPPSRVRTCASPPASTEMPMAHHTQGAHQPRSPLLTQVAVGESEKGCASHTREVPGRSISPWCDWRRWSEVWMVCTSTWSWAAMSSLEGWYPSRRIPASNAWWTRESMDRCGIWFLFGLGRTVYAEPRPGFNGARCERREERWRSW